MIPESMMEIIREKLGDKIGEYLIPAPIADTLGSELLAFDAESGTLTARFPVLEKYLNPYGAMQGGMVAAAIDDTLGPLSMLVAPPNLTRRLEIKYSRPVTADLGHIMVTGKLSEREGRYLTFRAEVRDQQGTLLAKAKAVHYIVD